MARGHDVERKVRVELEDQGWWVGRVCGSLGDADLVALRADRGPHLIEVKSTAGGPYERFGPAKRRELLAAAARAGAVAVLAYWPPGRGKRLQWIRAEDWPE